MTNVGQSWLDILWTIQCHLFFIDFKSEHAYSLGKIKQFRSTWRLFIYFFFSAVIRIFRKSWNRPVHFRSLSHDIKPFWKWKQSSPHDLAWPKTSYLTASKVTRDQLTFGKSLYQLKRTNRNTACTQIESASFFQWIFMSDLKSMKNKCHWITHIMSSQNQRWVSHFQVIWNS